MTIWQKSAQVGKVDRFSADVKGFSAGQPITSITFTSTNGRVTISDAISDGDIVSALFTGVSVGSDEIEINVSTATRSRCSKVLLLVEEC